MKNKPVEATATSRPIEPESCAPPPHLLRSTKCFHTENHNQQPNTKQNMKHTLQKVCTLVATLITFGSLAGAANGAIVVYFTETGSNVVATVSGSLNTSGTSVAGTGGFSGPQGVINGATHAFGDAAAYGLASSYGRTNLVLSAPLTPFGALPTNAAFIPSTPDIIGMEIGYFPTFSNIVLPAGYTSGSPINYSVTLFGGTSLTDFGFVAGVSWGVTLPTSSGTDSITFQTQSIPEPSLALLLGLGMLGFVARRRRTSSNKSRRDNPYQPFSFDVY
jgi:hypothetical protein